MSRIGITYQDVATAAITVQGHDEIPTVDRVREILRTGSKSTIARYLKEWKIKNEYIQGSDGVPEELIAIVKGLWDRLKNEAEQKIVTHQQEVDLTIAEIRKDYTKEQKHNLELQTQIRQLEENLQQQTNLANGLKLSLEEEKCLNAKLNERNTALSQQCINQKSETERLHQLLSHVQANLEHYQTSMQKLHEEHTLTAENQRVSYEREANSLKQELSAAVSQRNHLHRELDQIQTELKLLVKQHDIIMQEKNTAVTQLHEKIMNEASLQSRCDHLNHTCDSYQSKITQQLEIISSHDINTAVLTDQLKQSKKSIENAQDTIHILRDEKLFLAQEKAHLEGQLKQFQEVSLV